MKPLEDAFASDIFRRVVLPGIVLALGLHPLVLQFLPGIEQLYGVTPTILVVSEIIILGLGISSATKFIYYVYEGFQLEWLTTPAGWLNRWRLDSHQRRYQRLRGSRPFEDLTDQQQAEVTKIFEFLKDFPLI